MTNARIAKLLGHIATMLEMDGANLFRVRAYREGARVIEFLPEPAAQLAKTEGRLQEIKGIGKDLERTIRDLSTSGTTELYAELTKKYPPTLMELTEIPGLGPKRVKALFEQLGIRGRDDLAAAARAGTLRELAGSARPSRPSCSRPSRPPRSLRRRRGCCSTPRGASATNWPRRWRRCPGSSAWSWRDRSGAGARPSATSTCWCAAAPPRP